MIWFLQNGFQTSGQNSIPRLKENHPIFFNFENFLHVHGRSNKQSIIQILSSNAWLACADWMTCTVSKVQIAWFYCKIEWESKLQIYHSFMNPPIEPTTLGTKCPSDSKTDSFSLSKLFWSYKGVFSLIISKLFQNTSNLIRKYNY